MSVNDGKMWILLDVFDENVNASGYILGTFKHFCINFKNVKILQDTFHELVNRAEENFNTVQENFGEIFGYIWRKCECIR